MQPDLIIVGAGSAGCVLAKKLVSAGKQVTLIEPPAAVGNSAGVENSASTGNSTGTRNSALQVDLTRDAESSHGQIDGLRHLGSDDCVDLERPANWLNLLGGENDWNHSTLASAGLAGRAIRWPRGRGIGGSSRINAMIWMPPTGRDMEVLTRASDGILTKHAMRQSLSLVEKWVKPEQPSYLSDAAKWFIDRALSEPATADQPMVYRRFNQFGRRWHTGKLIEPIGGQLTTIRAIVDRICFDQKTGSPPIASGVEVLHPDSSRKTIRSKSGVILAAGSIGSPTLLMRSGIGPTDILEKLRIDRVVSCDLVGRRLRDHVMMPIVFQTARESFTHGESPQQGDQPTATQSVGELVRWQNHGSGPFTCNIAECGGLFRDESIQLHITPTNWLTYPKPSADPMMSVGVNVTHPKSQGRIAIVSKDPRTAPEIDTGYFSDDQDLDQLADAVLWVRGLMAGFNDLEEQIDQHVVEEWVPGLKRHSAKSIIKSITRYAQTLYHPVGTCSIGVTEDHPVACDFSVRQTVGLWCVDGSVLPNITTANPSVTIMMLANLASDQIIAKVNSPIA